jgi:hypothetical protein
MDWSEIRTMKKTIKEEIGRNFHTLNNDPIPFDYDDNIQVSTIGKSNGDWQVTIIVKSHSGYSVPTQTFKDEQMADHYAKQQVQSITSALNNESIIREYVSKYILNLL